MLQIRIRINLTDFLDEVCFLFRYTNDCPELDKYIFLWDLTNNTNFCKTLTKVINIQTIYTGDEDMDKERNVRFDALLPEFTRYSRDSVLDYDIHPMDVDDFAYAFRHYISNWITEFDDFGKVVKELNRRADILDVIVG